MSWNPNDPKDTKDKKETAEIKKEAEPLILSSTQTQVLSTPDKDKTTIPQQQNKIASSISKSFLKEIMELMDTKNEKTAAQRLIIAKYQQKAKDLGEALARASTKELDNKKQSDAKQDKEKTQTKPETQKKAIKKLRKQLQGLKINKGDLLDESGNKVLDKEGKPIHFDFSILFDELGHAIALKEPLGQGKFGEGRAAADLNDLSRDLFVKVYRTPESFDMPSPAQKQKRGGPYAKLSEKDLTREIRKHKENMSYYGFVATPNKSYLIQERALGIELFDYINAIDGHVRSKRFVEHDVLMQLLQASIAVCKEVQRLHDLACIHRDIKPENIIFNAETLSAKLIDLSTLVNLNYAKSLDRPQKPGKTNYSGVTEVEGRDELVFYAPSEKIAGTPRYIAPEIVDTMLKKGNIVALPHTYRGLYSKASDRFAVGKTIDIMFTTPLDYFHKEDPKNPRLRMDKATYEALAEIKAIIWDLCDSEPDERSEFNNIIGRLTHIEQLYLEYLKTLEKPDHPKTPTAPGSQPGSGT